MKLIYATLLFVLLLSSKTISSQSASPVVRLFMNTSGFNDETVFYFQQGGTTAFQSDMDAYKLIPNQGQFPYMGSLSDSVLTSISGLPPLPVNLTIAVKAISPATKSFTFSAESTDFPGSVCVSLFDCYTGISTNILADKYVCTLYDTTTCARFKMKFFTSLAQGISSLKQPACSSPQGGLIVAAGSGSGPWNFEWSIGDSVIKTCYNKTVSDSLNNLSGGMYSLKVSNVGQCSAFTRNFEIISVVIPSASFVADSYTTSLSDLGKISFTNTSSGNQINSWEFGDNSGTWFMPNASHNYISSGTYTVTLTTESIHHCRTSSSKLITVIDDVTGMSELDLNNQVLIATLSQGNYELKFQLKQMTDVQLYITDLKGSIIQSSELRNISSASQAINLSSSPQGIYIVKLVSKEGAQKNFKVIN
ncbi:hypothetical protein CNR22_09590 [Sphingobacteriaceae bacterium]|nr:hypothetical protein CNR22_09590 [Sphingobacteriaceae bacterium]